MKVSIYKRILNNKESKNAIWLISGKVAQMLLSLFVGVISARYLGPSNYGLISYANAMVAFVMSFCTLGINSVIVKELYDYPEEQGKTLGSAIMMRVISSVLSAGAVIGVSSLLDYGEWETVIVVALCSISLVFHAFDTINYWFQSRYKSNVTAIAGFLAYFATAAYKILLLILNKNVFWFAFATSIDYIVLSIIYLIAYRVNNGQKLSFSFKSGIRILKKSYHYILAGMMVSIYGHTDKLMLKQMLGESEVGYYATAVAVCGMWTFVLSAIIDAMYPTIISSFKQSKEIFERKNRQLYAIVFYVTVFVSVIFLIFGEFGIWLLYGEEYLPAAIPLKIITWYTAFSYFGVARNAWMVCSEKQKYLKYMYIVAAILNVILNFAFIPLWGASGGRRCLAWQASVRSSLPRSSRETRSPYKVPPPDNRGSFRRYSPERKIRSRLGRARRRHAFS